MLRQSCLSCGLCLCIQEYATSTGTLKSDRSTKVYFLSIIAIIHALRENERNISWQSPRKVLSNLHRDFLDWFKKALHDRSAMTVHPHQQNWLLKLKRQRRTLEKLTWTGTGVANFLISFG